MAVQRYAQGRHRQRPDLQPGRDRQTRRPGALYVAAPRTGAAAVCLVDQRLRSVAAVERCHRKPLTHLGIGGVYGAHIHIQPLMYDPVLPSLQEPVAMMRPDFGVKGNPEPRASGRKEYCIGPQGAPWNVWWRALTVQLWR